MFDRKKYGRDYSKRYRLEHPEWSKKKSRAYQKQLKIEVFSHYSNGVPKCAICSITELKRLVLDHIDGKGEEHRKENNYAGGTQTWIWARKNNYPPIFQVLCYRHNNIKKFEALKKENVQLREKIQQTCNWLDKAFEREITIIGYYYLKALLQPEAKKSLADRSEKPT